MEQMLGMICIIGYLVMYALAIRFAPLATSTLATALVVASAVPYLLLLPPPPTFAGQIGMLSFILVPLALYASRGDVRAKIWGWFSQRQA